MRMTLSKKLVSSFFAVAVLVFISGFFGLSFSKKIARSADIIGKDKSPQQYVALTANLALVNAQKNAEKYKNTITGLDKLQADIMADITDFSLWIEMLKKGTGSDEFKNSEYGKIFAEKNIHVYVNRTSTAVDAMLDQIILKNEDFKKDIDNLIVLQKDFSKYCAVIDGSIIKLDELIILSKRQLDTWYEQLKNEINGGVPFNGERYLNKTLFGKFLKTYKTEDKIIAQSFDKIDKALAKIFEIPDKIEPIPEQEKKMRIVKMGISNMSKVEKNCNDAHFYLTNLYKDFDNKKNSIILSMDNNAKTINELMKSLIAKLDEEMDTAIDEANSQCAKAALFLPLIIVFALAISVAMGILISRKISLTVKGVLDVVKEVAQGNLKNKVCAKTNDEIGDLADNINLMIDSLAAMVGQVKSTTLQVAGAIEKMVESADQISQGSEQLASASTQTAGAVIQMSKNVEQVVETVKEQNQSVEKVFKSSEDMSANVENVLKSFEKQATSLEEATAAINEIYASVNNVADNSNKVNDLAIDIKKGAYEGNSSVKESVKGMRDIADSSQKINSIIEVITSISSQTNLLALNAAIEAARAGEAGKGFAVVADEVRNLADQSAQAANEITSLILDANKKAEKGVQLIENVDKIITAMIKEIEEISNLIEVVTNSTEEQKKGAGEISVSMENLNKITHETLAAMEQQARETAEITKLMGAISASSEQINAAMKEQSNGFREITISTERVSSIAAGNETSAKLSKNVTADLDNQIKSLDELVEKFSI